jgi:hypothetical protein
VVLYKDLNFCKCNQGVGTLTFWKKFPVPSMSLHPTIPKSFFSTASEVTKFKIFNEISSATTVSGLRMQIYSPALRRYYSFWKTNIILVSDEFNVWKTLFHHCATVIRIIINYNDFAVNGF